MDEQNLYLEKLVMMAQKHPPGSRERNRSLSRLFCQLQNSGELASYRSWCPSQLQGNYEEIYAEAIQKLFEYMTKHIDKYEILQGTVLQWANGLLKYRFLDAIRDWREFDKRIKIISLDDLETFTLGKITENKTLLLSEQIIKVIEEDPDRIFQNTYTCQNRRANFRYITLKRLEGMSWQELSQELDLKVAALSNFYQRSLDKFAPLIIKYLSE